MFIVKRKFLYTKYTISPKVRKTTSTQQSDRRYKGPFLPLQSTNFVVVKTIRTYEPLHVSVDRKIKEKKKKK